MVDPLALAKQHFTMMNGELAKYFMQDKLPGELAKYHGGVKLVENRGRMTTPHKGTYLTIHEQENNIV